jgi:hypothetical protein
MHAATLIGHAGQLPVLGAQRVQLFLAGQFFGLEVTHNLSILPPGLKGDPWWLEVSTTWLRRSRREGHFNLGRHKVLTGSVRVYHRGT